MSKQAQALTAGAAGRRPQVKTTDWRGQFTRLGLGSILPLLALVVWQLSAKLEWISPLLFPAPSDIAASFARLIESGVYFENLGISLSRVIGGFALGGGLGLLFGLLVGFFRPTERALDPTVQMIRMVPSLAVAPLFVLWFGFGEPSKVLLIAKGAFFPLYINTFLGIRNVDNKLFDVARVLGFSRFKQVTRLIIPGALPNILLGVRLSLGVAWLGLVVAELLGSTSGIGYIMSDARQFNKTSIVFVGIITFAVFGQLADSLIRALERRLLRWRDSFEG